MNDAINYPFEMRLLTSDEGGGWLITFPDLPACMSDGETPEEAIINGRDAACAWLQAAEESGRDVPAPGGSASGRFTAGVPHPYNQTGNLGNE